MMSGKRKRLLDVCDLIIDCEHKTAPTQEEGYPSIRTPNIGRGRLILEGVNKVSEETYVEWTRRAVPQANDLILAREAPVGNVAIIPDNLKVCLGQRTVLIRPNIQRILPNYLLYLMLGREVQNKIHSLTAGATVAHLNMSDIRDFELPEIPDRSSQQKIASILSAYDDLIENNTRRIEVLEEMAHRIYREWFVYFRFPGHENVKMVDSELGEIPEGWIIRTIEKACSKINSGGTPSRRDEEYWSEGSIDWYKTKELKDSFLIASEEKITNAGLKNSSAKIFNENTIVMAIYAAPTVGKLGILTKQSCFNQAACGLVPDNDILNTWFLFLKLYELRDYFNLISRGAAQQNINVQKVEEAKILIPNRSLMKKFGELVEPIFLNIRILKLKNINLHKTRDRLLPKLISGQIDVDKLDIDIGAIEGELQ